MIIKYTNEKYLDAMLDQGQVRLSTYWHFRAHEDAEIGDPEEGQSGFLFRNDTSEPWEIAPPLLDAAALSIEGYPRFSEARTLMPGEEGWIESAGGFNTFMFSMTEADAPSAKLMERLRYDSAIEVVDEDAFATHTARALRQHLIREFAFDQDGYTRMRCISKPVEYVESKRRIVTPSTVERLLDTTSIAVTELFTKPKTFEYQSEFRIAYFVMDPKTNKTLTLDNRLPGLYPLVVGDAGIPRIAPTLRRISASEFVD